MSFAGAERKKATFAAGCFWGVEYRFSKHPGVTSTAVGYTGGRVENPSYEDVCYKDTGHAEAVLVEYDPAVTSFRKLLEAFFGMHDPTTLDRQGPDVGDQYRSAIFFHDDAQREEAMAYIAELGSSDRFRRPVVTKVEKAGAFYRAEEYHQRYIEKKGAPSCH